MAGSCFDTTINVPISLSQVNPLAVGLCFLFGLILGVLLALLVAKIVLSGLTKDKVLEQERALRAKQGYSRQAGDGESLGVTNTAYNDEDEIGERKRPIPGPSDEEYEDESSSDSFGKDSGIGMALCKSSIEKIQVNLTFQDLTAIRMMDYELKDERARTFLQLILIILNRCVSKGRIDQEYSEQIIETYQKNVVEGTELIRQEQKAAEEELKENEQLAKDPISLEEAVEALRPEYARRMESLIKQEQFRLHDQLERDTELSSEELEQIMEKLVENMAMLDKKLGEEAVRQATVLQERLAQRQLLAEKWTTARDFERQENQARVEDHSEIMDKLIEEHLLFDAQKESIMKEYMADQKQLQERHEAELLKQSRDLAERLKMHRESKLKKLEAKQKEQAGEMMEKAAKVVNPTDFVEAHHNLMSQHHEQREEFINELDYREAEEMNLLKKRLQEKRTEEINSQEMSFFEALAAKARLSEKEADKLIRKHEAAMKVYNENQDAEKKKQTAQLQERLEERRLKWEQDQQQMATEQSQLNDQQDKTVRRLLVTQAGLDEEARRQIMLNHQQNMQSLNNQMQISKLRQQKILEAKLGRRRAQVQALRRKQQEEMAAASLKERKKLEQQHQLEMKAELEAIETEQHNSLDQLRSRLAKETEESLKAQDEQLGLLIGKLQVGQARRQGIIQKQDKAIKELKEQMVDTVTENSNIPEKKTQKLLQQHMQQVEDLQQRMEEEKEWQMKQMREKIESRKMQKEKQIDETITKDKAPLVKKNSSMAVSNVMMKMLNEQRHKQALDDLEKEMKLEMIKQREELNRDLEDKMQQELEEREKDLLSNLAALSNMSQGELSEMVQTAVEEGGGDEKLARKINKDFSQRIKSAKSMRGGVNDLEDGEDYGTSDASAAKKIKKKKKKKQPPPDEE